MKKILVVAPHPDDEIIGAGGMILKNISLGNEVYVCIVTKGCMPLFTPESVEIVQSEAKKCHEIIGVKHTFFFDFPASMLEEVHRHEINNQILQVIKQVQPDEVFIPHIGDMQKDHQIVAECCMVALRPKYPFAPKRIYTYETLSETGWNIPNVQNEFIPNAYVDISGYLEAKAQAMKVYNSQVGKFPEARSIDTMESLAKYRGSVMNLNAAEAFMVVREID